MTRFRVQIRRPVLTEEQRIDVRRRFKTLPRIAANYAAVARELRVSETTIRRCVCCA